MESQCCPFVTVSLGILSSRLILVVAGVRTFLLFKAEYSSIVWMDHHASIDGNFLLLSFWRLQNNAAMTKAGKRPSPAFSSLEHIPRSGMAGSASGLFFFF